MIFLNHLKNQTYEKKRVIARNIAIGFGGVMLIVWIMISLGFSRKTVDYPDFKTPFSALSASASDVVESVSTGIANLKK